MEKVTGEEPKTESKRMKRLREIGLIGCMKDTGITSNNYKKIIEEILTEKFNRERND